MCQAAEIAIQEATQTLDGALELLGLLDAVATGTPEGAGISMAKRHATELGRYLEPYRHKLEEWRDKTKSRLEEWREARDINPSSQGSFPEVYTHLLAARRFELDSALRFIREAFVAPRQDPRICKILAIADWLCVEGFQLFCGEQSGEDHSHPLGPLVALDAQRSPAVWKEDSDLLIPSLFSGAMAVRRGKSGALHPFPVVCLPNDLVGLSEYFALLSHEVGHAVDSELGLSAKIIESLPESKSHQYWRAWMREIVADAAGLALSGEAFALAWWRFIQRTSPDIELTYSSPYPPMSLRLSFLRSMLKSNRQVEPEIVVGLPPEDFHSTDTPEIRELRDEFQSMILPMLIEAVFSRIPEIKETDSLVRFWAEAASGDKPFEGKLGAFRLLPSVVTVAIAGGALPIIRGKLPSWCDAHREQHGNPDWWSNGDSEWKFSGELVPTMRPPILGPDGKTKVPPAALLATHRRIAFLGNTNKWLCEALEQVLTVREEPWEILEIFFASDSLLGQVERRQEDGTLMSREMLIEERDIHLERLKKFATTNAQHAPLVRFFEFDGPPVFASYWDWENPGGRIHASPQLLGTDLSKCPAVDYLWLQEEPTYTYGCYSKHLEAVREKSRPI